MTPAWRNVWRFIASIFCGQREIPDCPVGMVPDAEAFEKVRNSSTYGMFPSNVEGEIPIHFDRPWNLPPVLRGNARQRRAQKRAWERKCRESENADALNVEGYNRHSA